MVLFTYILSGEKKITSFIEITSVPKGRLEWKHFWNRGNTIKVGTHEKLHRRVELRDSLPMIRR